MLSVVIVVFPVSVVVVSDEADSVVLIVVPVVCPVVCPVLRPLDEETFDGWDVHPIRLQNIITAAKSSPTLLFNRRIFCPSCMK